MGFIGTSLHKKLSTIKIGIIANGRVARSISLRNRPQLHPTPTPTFLRTSPTRKSSRPAWSAWRASNDEISVVATQSRMRSMSPGLTYRRKNDARRGSIFHKTFTPAIELGAQREVEFLRSVAALIEQSTGNRISFSSTALESILPGIPRHHGLEFGVMMCAAHMADYQLSNEAMAKLIQRIRQQ